MNGQLTVSMIVKDEERFLPQCLASVRGVADEILVVDTGSADHTVDIARSFGAQVVEIAWPNDFSKARNVGLDLVKTPWVLILDADEELVSDDASTLQQAIEHPFADAYNLRIVSLMDRAEDISESYVTRLFRSHPKIRFTGAVHEQVFPAVQGLGMAIRPLDVRLLHKGYLAAVVRGKDKGRRNLQLIQSQLNNKSDDAYMQWQLAQTLLGNGEAQLSQAAARKALSLIPVEHPLWVLAQYTYARTLEFGGQPKRALRVLREGQVAFPAYTDFYYLQGCIQMRLEQWEQAEKSFRKCLELGEPKGFLMTETGIGGFKSLYRLSQVLHAQNRPQEALATLLVALGKNPPFREGWQGMFTILVGSNIHAVLDAVLLSLPLDTVINTISQWQNRNSNEENLLLAAQERWRANQQNSTT
ncbi:MAG: glycosyl transferase family 2 [Sulfobacillus acidophilus]|uniref:Glycosyl transferase family 2 n=1 Tax=Sulfobacillus acidophilus TaxID=53633 RepID=A0A2T2WLA4_9FIRM|nr:MAG: glycosyl transferase family 2 [Sulfobacillus acidophilus]